VRILLRIPVYLAHCFDLNRFVGGLRIIFWTLLPFFIVAGAILIAFSFTYRIAFKISNSDDLQEINDIKLKEINDLDDYLDFKDSLRYQCIDSYEVCLTKMLQAFFSGGDVESWLDIVFGVVTIIIVSLFCVYQTLHIVLRNSLNASCD